MSFSIKATSRDSVVKCCCEHQRIALLEGQPLALDENVGIIGVAHVGQSMPITLLWRFAQTPREGAGFEVISVYDRLHAGARVLPDTRRVGQDARNRRRGDARLFGDIVDGDVFFNGHSLSLQKQYTLSRQFWQAVTYRRFPGAASAATGRETQPKAVLFGRSNRGGGMAQTETTVATGYNFR
jgi:hypothetical protein